jgi:flavin reductase (DIM6/NTAB) family NADH-FMN oxidoreductase RutF
MSMLRHHDVDTAAEPVSDDLFRSVFRDHAARVVVVTAQGHREPVGFTATSLTSVSLSPPMVSFAVARTASAWPTLSRAPLVAIHLLARDQHGLATTFATSGINRFAGLEWRAGVDGEPLIEGCAAYLSCEVVRHVPAGDHVVLLARVTRARVDRTGEPLIYHDGGYASVGAAPSRPVQPPALRRLSR